LRWFFTIYSWLKKLKPFITTYIVPAIRVVQMLKQAMNQNGTGQDIKQWLHTIFKNDQKVDQVLAWIGEAITQLGIGSKCFQQPGLLEMIQCFLTEIRKQPKHVQHQVWREIAKYITIKTTKKILSNSDLDTAVQIGYKMVTDK